MVDLTGLLSLLMGVILVSLSALGLVTMARLRGVVANLLALLIVAYALPVLLAQILSEMHWVSRAGFLIGHGVIAGIVLPWSLKPAYGRLAQAWVKVSSQSGQLKQWRFSNPALVLLGVLISGSMLLGAYLILAVPPNSTDGLFYHLSRVAHWLQNGTLHHFQAPLLQRTVFPINLEIGLLWLTALSGTDRLGGFLQWFATIAAMLGIYGVARQLEFPRSGALFAAFIWSTFTIVVVQATAVKNDIIVTFFFIALFYFLLAGLQAAPPKDRVNFIFFGLALGLALGAKSTAWLALPGLGLMAAVLAFYKPGQFLPKLIYAGGCGLVGFILVGAYNYLLNWLNYQSPFGPATVSAMHLVQHPSPVTFGANLGRIGYDFFDLSGLPEAIMENIQPWRSLIGQKLFALLQLEPNPPGANFSREFDFNRGILPPYEKNAWYGPLGALLLLPTLIFYLCISPLLEKNIWKWFTALIPVVFLLVFAYLVRWQTQLGRLFLIAVTLGTPLMAGFYIWSEKYKLLRWTVVALALLVLGWSAAHNHHKPVFGPQNIWDLDYYELRLIQRPSLAPIARYVDTNLPPRSKLGLAGDEAFRPDRTDYLFWGPDLKREVIYIGPIPGRLENDLFARYHLDYLIFALEPFQTIASAAPLWPIGQDQEARWFLVKQQEMALFTTLPHRPELYQKTFGDDYLAYVEILAALKKGAQPFRVLTTDPRMPYYDRDERFVFDFPEDLGDLKGFTHLVFAPYWSAEDYQEFNVSFEEVQFFLSQEQFVKKVSEVHDYTLYQILF